MPLKIPNPTTDVAIWDSKANDLAEFDGYAFNHKAMGNLFARKMRMGAKGRTGEQAIAASAQAPDASRDSVPMMSKQDSNILRAIGMILPVQVDGRNLYMISPLLMQILSIEDRNERITQFWRYLIRAYVNPSNHTPTKSSGKLKPNVTTMRMQIDLDGGCIPWEILIGPQCQLSDDRDKDEYESMIASIREVRKKKTRENLFETVTQYQKDMISGKFGGNYAVGKKKLESGDGNKIKEARSDWNNWTRVSAQAGLNAGICEKGRASNLGYSFSDKQARMLTTEGRKFADRITSMRDVRAEDIEEWPEDILHAMLRVVNDNLLMEWGIKIDKPRRILDLQIIHNHDQVLHDELVEDKILHTPYSEHSVEVLVKAGLLNISNLSVHPGCDETAPELTEAPTFDSKQLDEIPKLETFQSKPFPWPDLTEDEILEKYVNSDATEFGNAVGKCFQCLGMKWELGRSGDVTDRIDGKASFANGYFIPIELKSPTEDKHVNLKSVRQAAENAMLSPQIAQDSGGKYKHSISTASLAVGWEIPPERSDLEDLIQRNRDYWGIRIKALSFIDLVRMARASSGGNQFDFSSLLFKSGIYR